MRKRLEKMHDEEKLKEHLADYIATVLYSYGIDLPHNDSKQRKGYALDYRKKSYNNWRCSVKTEKEILFDKVKDTVLHCFEKTEDGESDHQCYNGEWYLPICGCDTLQDIIDSIEQEILG